MDEDKCRICLRKPFKPENVVQIKDNHEGSSLSTIFQKLTSFKIKSNEPQIFCDSCKNELIFCFFFYNKCREAQQYFDHVPIRRFKQEETQDLYFHSEPPIVANPIENSEVFFNENESIPFDGYDDNTDAAGDGDDNPVDDSSFHCQPNFDESGQLSHMSVDNDDYFEDEPFVCRQCPPTEATVCNQLNNFLEHVKLEHGTDAKTICPLCNRGVKYYFYKEHYERVHFKGVKPLVCDLCGARFRRKRYLAGHMRKKHIRERSHQCDVCFEYFCIDTINIHKRKSHPDVYPPYKCVQCDYTSEYKRNVTVHMLRKHLRVTNNESNQLEMGKFEAFESNDDGNDQQILKKSSKKKIYKCKHCAFSSPAMTNVLSHQVEVHKKKPKGKLEPGMIYCKFCPFASKTRTKVFAHAKACHFDLDKNRLVQIDNTKIIHRCKYCEFGGSIRSNVVRHMKTLHGDESKETYVERIMASTDNVTTIIYRCKYCRYISEFKNNVIRHQKKKHGDDGNAVAEQVLTGTSKQGETSVNDQTYEDEEYLENPNTLEFLATMKQELRE